MRTFLENPWQNIPGQCLSIPRASLEHPWAVHPWAGAQHPPRTLTLSAPPPPVPQNRADLESEKQKIGAVVRNLQRELEESAEETGHWREMFQRNKDELRAAKQECVPANQGVLGAGGVIGSPHPILPFPDCCR